MNFPGHWAEEFNIEINRAVQARANGNEGMARVCARRAAGIAIAEYLNQLGIKSPGSSIIDRLAVFSNLPGVNPAFQEIVSHFITKVDQNHRLPVDADLIKEAILLKDLLVGVSTD